MGHLVPDRDLLEAAAAWSAVFAPPRARLSVLDRARTLRVGDGPAQGKPLQIDGHPAVRAVLAAIETQREVIIAGPVQDGKTYSGCVVPILQQILDDRRPVVLGAPRFELAAELYTAKIRGTFEASGLTDRLPTEGAASRNGVPDEILFPTGCRLYLRGMGGANESQLAGITARMVVLTEADAVCIGTKHARRRAEQEGRRKVALIKRRTVSFGADSRIVIESTVKDDQHSLILTLHAESSGGILWHECPYCRAFHPRTWDLVTYDAADAVVAAATARLACPGCGVLLSPEEITTAAASALVVHRGQRVEAGRVVGPMPPTSAWGIRWSSLDSPLAGKSLDLLVVEHRDAMIALRDRGDVSLIKQFVRDHLTRAFIPEEWGADLIGGRTVAPTGLAARSAASDYPRGVVPFPAGTLAVGIDMQEREAWWLALCLDGDRIAVVDYACEYLCHRHESPTPAQRMAVLERIRERAVRGWPTEAGDLIPAAAIGCDVGGRGWLDQVDAWLRSTAWRAWAMRGDPRPERGDGAGRFRLPGWLEVFRRDDGRRLMLADPACKGRLIDGLAAPPASPVACLLPRDLAADDPLIRHLAAEERGEPGPKGPTWIKRGKNDLLDAGTYGLALARLAAVRRNQPRRARGEIIIGE